VGDDLDADDLHGAWRSSAIVSTSSTERPPPVAGPRIITVFRTDADPRTVDLSLDSSERP
jgi:hypothetical protein